MTLRTSLGFDWWRFELWSGPRFIARFRDRAEGEAYLARLARPPTLPGPEFQALADELASALRLRGGTWKRKEIEEDDAIDVERNAELPF
jgi:hypothetical protein